ncbi:MAG: AbrB/MazE/SpoVT family DNA-binding domain-containing protein [Nanoarchaeota archaeon]|nr:AbrB/MazE/SpoVT family DNA-binding domain-containing protein [Nanoarchaeota archaeon]
METTRMSSKGQVVIPQDIRQTIGAEEGTMFSVMGIEDTVILKKIKAHSNEEIIKTLDEIAAKNQKRLQAMGFTEKDILKAAERERARKKS